MESRGVVVAKSVGIVFGVSLAIFAAGVGLLALVTRNNSMLRRSLLDQLLDGGGLVAVVANRTQAAGTLQTWWMDIVVIAFVAALLWIGYTHFLRPGYPKAEASARALWYVFFVLAITVGGFIGYREFHIFNLSAAFDPTFFAIALVATASGAILSYIMATALAVKPELRGSALFASLLSRLRL